MKAWAVFAALTVWWMLHSASAFAIDFYEIQIYTTDTTPKEQLTLELHSNTVTTATGQLAHQTINPYQIHETLEATYGVFDHLEVGQYFCTAKLNNGNYEYAGSRSKMHFGISQTDRWPISLGGNIELDYMRFAAEDNPFTLELRPILESHLGHFDIVANLALEKPFSGPTTHQGMQFDPVGRNRLRQALSLVLTGVGVLRRHGVDCVPPRRPATAALSGPCDEPGARSKVGDQPRRRLRPDARQQRRVFEVNPRLDLLAPKRE